ncbi:DUF421 domain-containing protein [Geodermatophilus sp. TF02-6]|uniref:DUF421 domain-containing protein n=1 Tax=Geodermatophilus sp. TF02-6 TaxID=2250575 RepID=UPI000DEBF575|nr:YetF domain-containing protein [Geodermatophilus sp. TF02-6]RBY83861.1 DUF421 domain-containing protein [Geodermatophilus sp. TF02-6]
MWHDVFAQQVPLLEKALRTALVYVVIWALLRVSGKRGLASTNTLDLIVAFLLASAVENAMQTNDDDSVTGAVVSAVTLIALNNGLLRLTNASPRAARILQGRPTTVVEDGHVDERGLKRLGMRPNELDHVVRSQNGDDISEIAHGELTPSGQFVLTLKDSEQSATKADVAALAGQLRHIEQLVAARR